MVGAAATAYMALKKLGVSGRNTLTVYGQGPVGLSATLLGKMMGAGGRQRYRPRRNSSTRAGSERDATLNPKDGDRIAAVREITVGEGADATLDCTGNAIARAETVPSARVFGRARYVGEGGTVELEPSPDIIHRHLTAYGSWTFNTIGLEECAHLSVQRQVSLQKLITDRFRLDQAVEAFCRIRQRRDGQVRLRPLNVFIRAVPPFGKRQDVGKPRRTTRLGSRVDQATVQ